MSELQEIEVFIDPNGTVKVEVRGAHGAKCLDFTKKLEALLGGNVIERNLTDDYHRQDDTQDDRLKQRI